MYSDRKIRLVGHRVKALRVAILIMVLILGCAGNMSHLQPNENLTVNFQNQEWIDGYRYYHYSVGWLSRRSYALIGLQPPYIVESRLWRQVEDPEELRLVIRDAIRASQDNQRGFQIRGFEIINPKGERVGVLYSSLFGSSVRFADDERVIPKIGSQGRGQR